MKQLQLTPVAEDDLHSILDYIAQDRPLTVRKVTATIRQKLELLATQPLMAELVTARPADMLRSYTILRWVVFYRVINSGIEVVRILDGARRYDENDF